MGRPNMIRGVAWIRRRRMSPSIGPNSGKRRRLIHGTQFFLVLILSLALLSACATRGSQPLTVTFPRNVPSCWPVACEYTRVTCRFGERIASGNQGGHDHRGIDIAAPKGTPVVATADGRVVYAKHSKNGYGRLVRIAHGGGIETWYAHLKSLDVKQGASVNQGQRIGRIGKSGRATGFHLHYEVHVDGEAVEPRRFLPAGPGWHG